MPNPLFDPSVVCPHRIPVPAAPHTACSNIPAAASAPDACRALQFLLFPPAALKSHLLPWHTNKILIFLIFPVFSGFSSLFTFLHFSLILAYFGISLHIFVINFGKNFGKFQVCTKGKSAIGNRQVRNWGLR